MHRRFGPSPEVARAGRNLGVEVVVSTTPGGESDLIDCVWVVRHVCLMVFEWFVRLLAKGPCHVCISPPSLMSSTMDGTELGGILGRCFEQQSDLPARLARLEYAKLGSMCTGSDIAKIALHCMAVRARCRNANLVCDALSYLVRHFAQGTTMASQVPRWPRSSGLWRHGWCLRASAPTL